MQTLFDKIMNEIVNHIFLTIAGLKKLLRNSN